MDKKGEEAHDVIAGLMTLLEQYPKLSADNLMAVLSLFTLLSIVNMIKPVSIQLPSSSTSQSVSLDNTIMDTISSLLQSKGQGGLNTGDLAGLLAKNPNAIMTLMNILSNLKEQKSATKSEESGKRVAHDEALSVSLKDKSTKQ